nr:immunoglobulin light chain junction region [Macaca mulatta]MOV63395.1 immunoglobulin light chain junction region [Macaca mulatta]
CQKYSPSPLTF